MNSDNLIKIEDELNSLDKMFKSALIDYKKYYILVETEPENAQYQNFFNGIKAELQSYSQKLLKISQDIITELNNIEKNVTDKSNKLEKQKEIYKKMLIMYEDLEQKQNGSSLFINDSKKLYNEQYYKNLHFFVGIIGLSFMLFYLSKKPLNNYIYIK
jgi:hypothetical protein